MFGKIKQLLGLIQIGMDVDAWFAFLPLEKKTQIYNWYTTKDDLSVLAGAYQK